MDVLFLYFSIFLLHSVGAQLDLHSPENDPTGIHRAESDYNIHGGYYSLDFRASGKGAGNIYDSGTCMHYAKALEEPYTPYYWPRKSLQLKYPWTEIKRAFWQWEGLISKEAFEEARTRQPVCVDCETTIHYKVVDGHLWAPTSAETSLTRTVMEELLKVIREHTAGPSYVPLSSGSNVNDW